ncbi:endo-1,4-beta-xylanase [Paenibacillus sp. PR3]|uniref:Beta-xylanase n=1 Tax=Paenibacillus terricola TaxID=2763503 RepID=A0ABR8N0V6_9BACL|nr:endo-1,4-beta-xylanase [Paenibacillus terricola]MBD3921783.1 endo-1,4-beta-xylanase [Paenibacillus terricola]
MDKRLKKILMLVFAAALLLPQIGIAQKANAADASTVVYDMQQDAGISGAAADSEFNYTNYIQNSGGSPQIHDNGNSIYVGQRTGDYNGADIKLKSLNLTAGTEYTFTVSGHVDSSATIPATSQIVLSSPNKWGTATYKDNYKWLVNKTLAAGGFTLEYTATFTADDIAAIADNTYFRLQTNADAQNVPLYVDNIKIAAGVSVVYDMQTDTQISGAADGSSFNGTGTLQGSGGGPVIHKNGKAIYLSARSGDYNGVDIKMKSLGLTAGAEYTFTVNGHVDSNATVPATSQIVLSSPNKWGTATYKDNYKWLVNKGLTTGGFSLEYTAAFTSDDIAAIADNTYFRLQTNADAQNVPFYVDNITVINKSTGTPVTPTTPPPASDKPVVAYDLQLDAGLADLVSGGGSTYLQRAGNLTINAVSNTNGTVSLDLSNRTLNYEGIDVKASAIGLKADVAYTVAMTGHIPNGVTIPGGAKIVLGTSGSPYATLAQADAAGTFTLNYNGTAAADTGETSGLRIQADPGLSRFVIDTLTVTVAGGTAMPPKSLSNVPGVHVSLTSNKDSWSGANIILGTDSSVWPFSTGDAAAFTPVKDAKYHLTFNATSTGASGYRVRWITGNDNGGYTAGDVAVVTADTSRTYQVGITANGLPASFTGAGVVKAQAIDYDVDFTMSGSELAQGLIGNIAIRGTSGSSDFLLNSIKITDDSGKVLVNWVTDNSSFVSDPYEWPTAQWDLTLPSLKDAYSKYFKIGNIMEPTQTTDATLTTMYDKQYNVVTAENSMKPENLLRNISSASDLSDLSKYNFAGSDQIVQWAEDHNQSIHGHTLVWHSQTPAFINTGTSGTRAAAKANMETFINNVIAHFDSPNLISWDVVNEAFDDNTAKFDGSDWRTGLRTGSPWYTAYANGADASKGESGADYIYDAFAFAHLAQTQIDSTATLYYNDYNETYKYEEIAQMVEDLNAQWEQDSRYDGRKLVEGIGMQSHFWINSKPDVNVQEVERAIKRFVETGARISVSELDIPYSANNNYHLDEAKLAEQAQQYGTLFTIYKQYAESIDRVTFWGKADIQSWRSSGMPLLFDNSFRPKAAFWTVIGLGDTTSSGGNGSGSGYVPPVTGETSIDSKDGQVTVKPKVEMKDGAATSVVSNDDLTKALKQAAANAEGNKQVSVEIPAQAGATSYGVQLPAASLKASGTSVISIKTDKAAIDIPSNMLANTDAAAADKVTIRVSDVSTAALSDAVRQQIGDRPVINLEALVDGNVISWSDPNAPIKVSIPYKPTAEELTNPDSIIIWYIDGSGQAIPVANSHYDAAIGSVVFTTTHFSNYAVAFVVKTFGDIQSVQWAKSAIEAMAARGIITGTSDTTFAPQAKIKRADFLVMLVRALELKGTNEQATTFGDVNESDYYYDAVNIARQLGIVKGTGDNLFQPNSSISRQDMMVLAARAAAAAGKTLSSSGSLDAFGDASKVSAYAQDSVIALVDAGIVIGSNGNLAPQSSLSRAEAAVILYRLWNK